MHMTMEQGMLVTMGIILVYAIGAMCLALWTAKRNSPQGKSETHFH